MNTRGYADNRLGDFYGKVQLEDTELFISEIVRKYPVSQENIFVAGHSHGATMVYYYLTHSDKFMGGIAVNGAADWIKQAELKSMTGLPGEMGGTPDSLMTKYQDYSPLENVSSDMSPILIMAGKKDAQIPSNINSSTFHDKAVGIGVKSELYQFENEGHLILKSENQDFMEKKILTFIENVLSTK